MVMFFENKINVRENRGSNQEWTHATFGTEQRQSKHRKLKRGKRQILPKKTWVNQDGREG